MILTSPVPAARAADVPEAERVIPAAIPELPRTPFSLANACFGRSSTQNRRFCARAIDLDAVNKGMLDAYVVLVRHGAGS